MHTRTDDVTRLFDQLRSFTPDEAEKSEYARHCRRLADVTPNAKPLSFSHWRELQRQRGNREGQNHD